MNHDTQRSTTVNVDSDSRVIDESDTDESFAPTRYEITSYGADYDVSGLVNRMKRGDVLIPSFQRNYVWKLPEASRFVESLLLGLPVPGVFLAKEVESNKLLVIDGQQRLKTLEFFFSGVFNPQSGEANQRVFKLTKVSGQFEGMTYDQLPERDKLQLNDYVLHATVIKQESPSNDDTSIYHVFERLNTGGQQLKPQEIREAVYHGALMDLVDKLNHDENWRSIFGKISPRLKDCELILRFLAFRFAEEPYKRPLSEYLNKFALKYRNPSMHFLSSCEEAFRESIKVISLAIGPKSFKPEGSLNAAVFDSVLVGISRRLVTAPIVDPNAVAHEYVNLLEDESYKIAISKATADEGNVALRLRRATDYFSRVK